MMRLKESGAVIGVCLLVAAGGLSSCGGSEPASTPPPNNAPVVDGLSADPVTVEPGGQTTITATVSDPDLESSSGGDAGMAGASIPEGLTLSWSVQNDDWSLDGEGGSVTLTAPDAYDASARLTVAVTDDRGAKVTESLRVETARNHAPRITQLNADANPVAAGATATLEAKATDANGDTLSYEWSVPENWTLASSEGGTAKVKAPDTAQTVGRVGLKVTDGYEGTAHSAIQLRTKSDARPRIAGMAADPPQVDPAGTTTVSVNADDPEDGELSYAWSVPEEWSVEGQGGEVKVTAPDRYGATGTVTVTVSDEGGQEVSGSIVVTTPLNQGPTISGFSASPQQVERGGKANLAVAAADPEGDALTYQWSVSKMDWSVTGNVEEAQVQAPDIPGATAKVTVTVSDADGKSATAEIIVSTVANRAPSIGSVSVSPVEVKPGGTAELRVSANDPDGDSLTYDWSAPKNWSVSSSGDTVTLTAPDSFGASAVVGVTVKDGFGGATSGSVAVMTKTNQTPTISNVSAQPVVVERKGTTTLKVAASDADGDPLSYSWKLPSGWKRSGSGAEIDVTAPDSYGVQGRFEVTVSDDNGASTTGSVTAQTVQNQPPVIVSMSADSTTVSPGGKTTVRVTAVELDGESLNYNWSVPSGWSGSSNDSSIEVTAPNQAGKSATIKVEVGDGHDTVSRTLKLSTVGP